MSTFKDNNEHSDNLSQKPDSNRRNLTKFLAASPLTYGVISSSMASSFTHTRTNAQPVALITGASSGFGNVTAKTLAKNGFHVIASMRNVKSKNAERAKDLCEFAKQNNVKLEIVEIDIDSDESVRSGIAEALSKTGNTIDVLFNNAGINIPGPVELSMESSRQSFETNVFGQLRMLREVAPIMRKNRHGLIIQMSSGLGRLVMPTSGIYCATKFAQEALFESAAYELHPFGIEVAIIQPSDYATNIKQNSRRYFMEMLESLDKNDVQRLKDYDKHIEVTMRELEYSPAPPAQEVADVVIKLALTEPGKRPLRQVSMPPELAAGLNQLNGTLEEVQTGMLKASGLDDWLELAKS
ncbi:MAG: SDR family oxidoreductase [Pseudomonadota bacterium]